MKDDTLQEMAIIDETRRRGRRRLVGAVVLALCAIIFVPMLLEKEAVPLGENVDVVIPPVASTRLPDTPPAPPSPASTVMPTAPPPVPAPTPTQLPEKKPPVETKTLPPTVTFAKGTFSVQLAAFTDDKGANAMTNKVKNAGYPAYTEPTDTARGMAWRVRVGPFKTREAAGGVRDRLKKDGYDSMVVPAR